MSEIKNIFSCKRCGYCCHGETTVSLNEDDQQRMRESLGLSRSEISDRYWRITGSVVQMQVRDGHCIFYDNGCSAHDGRPWRCAEWPLHPSILDDENNYHTISASCPGINSELSYEKFCEILRQILKDSGRAKC